MVIALIGTYSPVSYLTSQLHSSGSCIVHPLKSISRFSTLCIASCLSRTKVLLRGNTTFLLLQLFKKFSNACDGLIGLSTSNSAGKYVIYVHFVKEANIDITINAVTSKKDFMDGFTLLFLSRFNSCLLFKEEFTK